MGRKDKQVSLEESGTVSIGQLMRQSRQQKGRSLSEMASRLGYTRGYLSMIENGHKLPTDEIISSYEKILVLEDGYISQAMQQQDIVSPSVKEQFSSYQNHLDILMQGVDVWNQWREEHFEVRPSLGRANLVEVNLIEANLSGADLTGANLGGAELSRADLSDAVLRQAYISGANLKGAVLSRANLSGAILSGANFSNANLSEANLSYVDLSGANLSGANLNEANLSGADLKMGDLSSAILRSVNLTSANLNMVDLSGAIIGNTMFGNVDFREVRGLEILMHDAPSTIGTDTLERSQGDIPEVFLRGAGLSDTFIDYARSLVQKPIDYYTCFISYSSKDEAFAKRLHNDLQSEGVRCWFAPEDMRVGDKIKDSIDASIRLYDKLLLVLSEHTIKSPWVEFEVERALVKERQKNSIMLFPIRLNQAVMLTDTSWIADIRRTRHISDFTRWTEHDSYSRAFHLLLRDLHIPSRVTLSREMAVASELAVIHWYEILGWRPEQNKKRQFPDLFVTDNNGNSFGVEIKFSNEPRNVRSRVSQVYKVLNNTHSEVDSFIIVVVLRDEASAKKAAFFLEASEDKPSNVSLVTGYIRHNEFYPL